MIDDFEEFIDEQLKNKENGLDNYITSEKEIIKARVSPKLKKRIFKQIKEINNGK